MEPVVGHAKVDKLLGGRVLDDELSHRVDARLHPLGSRARIRRTRPTRGADDGVSSARLGLPLLPLSGQLPQPTAARASGGLSRRARADGASASARIATSALRPPP